MIFPKESKGIIFLALLFYAFLKILFIFEILTPYIEQVIIYSMVIIIASVGLNVIYGYTGQFSLGHAAFYGIGAYLSGFIAKRLAIEDPIFLVPCALLSGAFSSFIAYLIGIPIMRLKDDFLAIATLGFGMLVRVFLDNSDRFLEMLGGSRGFPGIPKLTNLELAFLFTGITLIATRNLANSSYGMFLRSIKEDELAASSIGVDVSKMKLFAFSYGCLLSGIAGSLYAHLYSFLHPSNFDILKSIDFLVIVIVGGMGKIKGTVYASLLWVGLIEGLRIVLPSEVLDLRWVFIPVFLVLIMIFRPQGLLSR